MTAVSFWVGGAHKPFAPLTWILSYGSMLLMQNNWRQIVAPSGVISPSTCRKSAKNETISGLRKICLNHQRLCRMIILARRRLSSSNTRGTTSSLLTRCPHRTSTVPSTNKFRKPPRTPNPQGSSSSLRTMALYPFPSKKRRCFYFTNWSPVPWLYP